MAEQKRWLRWPALSTSLVRAVRGDEHRPTGRTKCRLEQGRPKVLPTEKHSHLRPRPHYPVALERPGMSGKAGDNCARRSVIGDKKQTGALQVQPCSDADPSLGAKKSPESLLLAWAAGPRLKGKPERHTASLSQAQACIMASRTARQTCGHLEMPVTGTCEFTRPRPALPTPRAAGWV